MLEKSLARPAIVMVVLVVCIIGGWETYLRSQGVRVSYDDGPPLWADKRAMVYTPADKAIVFIGSSRIKYDLDIDTWEKITGKKAIQLACVGSSPLPVLKDLGNDENFKGKLVVDVTEVLFFSPAENNYERPVAGINYYKARTPAQRASFVLNHALESQFVFLDKESFSLNAKLGELPVRDRPGVFVFPTFPMDFNRVDFDRQNKMTPRFVADTSISGKVKNIWIFLMNLNKSAPRPKEDPTPGIMRMAKEAVDKIKARGGEVIFTRTPSSGPFLAGEKMGFPRAKFWDQLLVTTQCKGIHFADDPATDHLVCPEWSHLSPDDAVLYTKSLIKSLPPSFGGTGQ